MQIALSIGAAGAGHSTRPVVSPHRATARLEPVHLQHPQRGQCEGFIAARFHQAHGARVSHFSPYLLGVRDGLDGWRAAAGYTPAVGHRLFLEQYLNAPVEVCLARRRGRPVARESIVEVGNLASSSIGMGRALIPLLARHLHRLGYEWVVFTATRGLRTVFARLGLTPLELGAANPARLSDGGAHWGSYYAQDPIVMAGRISHGVRMALSK